MEQKHILLAEDEEHIRLTLSMLLRKAGYKVTMVKDGLEALQKIVEFKKGSKPVDLLLTDIQMPGKSGLELIDELAELNIDLPVLVLTGYGNKNMIVDLMRKGCADYIDKPFEGHELLERLPPIFEKTAKARQAKEKESAEIFSEKAELNRQIESYLHNYEKLRTQVESAVGAYQNLVQIQKNGYNVLTAFHIQPLSELGGDFADIRDTSAGCDILIADVAGHDMGASYHTVLIKAFFDENCRTGNDGLSFFQLLNQHLLENGNNERMVTALFFRINLKKMHGEVVSAGHPPMIRVQKNTPVPDTVTANGDILGINENVAFGSKSFPLVSGDRFFIYTDGLTNAYCINRQTGKREKLDQEGLDDMIKKYCHQPLKKMVGSIRKEMSNYRLNDDMLLLGVEIP
ncbi:MAG: fused response regulator/phosphatase [Desulfobacteraceae bacterium]|nr:fused response regulator/phosphatase [Desulfobacteraceae bacterium]